MVQLMSVVVKITLMEAAMKASMKVLAVPLEIVGKGVGVAIMKTVSVIIPSIEVRIWDSVAPSRKSSRFRRYLGNSYFTNRVSKKTSLKKWMIKTSPQRMMKKKKTVLKSEISSTVKNSIFSTVGRVFELWQNSTSIYLPPSLKRKKFISTLKIICRTSPRHFSVLYFPSSRLLHISMNLLPI